jgi:hypothetical protein
VLNANIPVICSPISTAYTCLNEADFKEPLKSSKGEDWYIPPFAVPIRSVLAAPSGDAQATLVTRERHLKRSFWGGLTCDGLVTELSYALGNDELLTAIQ